MEMKGRTQTVPALARIPVGAQAWRQ